jgi:thioredoxin reductase (NADPH)
MAENFYDLIIAGAGPAGLTAGIYASRYKLKVLLIGQMEGGLMTESHKICNFPSEQDISGLDLAEKMKNNALSQGMEIKNAEIEDISKTENGFEISLAGGKNYFARTVLLATGTKHRQMGLAGEDKFLGRGVSYCATCDGMFYKNKTVAVIGGNDSALTAALYLADIAEKVYLIYRGQKLRGEPAWLEKINQSSKIEILLETNIQEIMGEEKLSGVRLDKTFAGKDELVLDGLFVEIGTEPERTVYMEKLKIAVDEKNYIQTGKDQKTSCVGIWAAGDNTNNSNNFRQIITACAEGAIAAEDIFRFMRLSH